MKRGYANRGKAFEKLLLISNQQYALKKWAAVEKVEPTFKTLGRHRNYSYGFYEAPGFVDFVGVANGRSICFEAKSTANRTNFPLNNIDPKQYKILNDWHNQGSISFLLIEFEKHKRVFLLTFTQLAEWWQDAAEGGRKSIPYEWFHVNCEEVKTDRGIVLDYLQALKLP